MSLFESNTPDFQEPGFQEEEPALVTRVQEPHEQDQRNWFTRRRLTRFAAWSVLTLLILAVIAFFAGRSYLRNVASRNLPQLDGSLAVPGLTSPVTVQRDARGVPHIQANSLDDLIFAQAFITTSDRLFQMDTLRRHAAGELAEILGLALVPHDRLQRTLQIRASADRAIAALPPDQLHVLEVYARGVNASIARQSAHLPIEFRILRYKPAPWTPRDSILVSLAMFQDLTNAFPSKLAREALTARLPANLPPDQRDALVADLYPVGSWRDHPPTSPIPDLTIEGPPIEDIPLDESQSSIRPGAPHLAPEMWDRIATTLRAPFMTQSGMSGSTTITPDPSLFTPGSNNWVVSGAHTASGKPLLSNDMHLSHSAPGIWYEADLQAASTNGATFHAAGVTIPGLPLIVVGHNDHIAWGFTNLGADVQDVYIEPTRQVATPKGQLVQFRASDGTWQPVLHTVELIKVHGLPPQNFQVDFTHHGDTLTPILNTALTPAATAGRILSLRWTIYDPSTLQLPTLAVNSAHDWPTFLAAFGLFGGPSQNVVYADDQGHIGYHAIGRIPLRGPATGPSAIPAPLPSDISSPVAPRSPTQSPTIAANPSPLTRTDIAAPAAPAAPQFSGPISPLPFIPTPAQEWDGYIPFNQLPQVFDPPGGVIATANARTAPDDYRYPITLDWVAPYRNERIWKSLAHRTGLRPEDMLALQSDIYSDFDHVLAQRLAYAIDATLLQPGHPLTAGDSSCLHQAADILRTFNGRMTTDSPAAAIVATVHAALWPALLAPKLAAKLGAPGLASETWEKRATEINALYLWGEKDYALEQILAHTPPRWLPATSPTWNDFLASITLRALANAHAPADLAAWRYGAIHTLTIEHPIFDQSPLLARVFGLPTGTGVVPQSGDATTIKQVGHTFGPSERLTVDLANPQHSTLNLVLGQSGNPISPWFLDQFPAWLRGSTYPEHAPPTHTLTLTPR